jgi:hypothetical protein
MAIYDSQGFVSIIIRIRQRNGMTTADMTLIAKRVLYQDIHLDITKMRARWPLFDS